MSRERTALVALLADLDHLDAEFEKLSREKTWTFKTRPSHYMSGEDVLLAGYGRRGSGDLYVFVGILRGVRLADDGHTLKFTKAERFCKPVVAVYGKERFHRGDLLGDLEAWGPSEFYYVLPEALTMVPDEAERSLVHRD